MCKDAKERDPFWFYDVEHDDLEDEFSHGDLDYEEDEFGFEEFGCVFGEECCMPGFHYRSECYTPEMAEEWSLPGYRATGPRSGLTAKSNTSREKPAPQSSETRSGRIRSREHFSFLTDL